MKFNSKLKMHIIYRYLEGDWAQAISEGLPASAALRGRAASRKACCPTFLFVAVTWQRLWLTEGPTLLPSTRNDFPLSGDDWESVRAQEVLASQGTRPPPFPKT